MPEPPSDCPQKPEPLGEWIPPAVPNVVRSVEPGDKVCEPVLNERARRKETDDELARQLDSIRVGVDTTRKLTGRVAIGVGGIVIAAGLEYLGVLGKGDPPIWARVVIDVLSAILGKN